MKSLTIALSLLGLSTIALAGAPGNQMVVPSGINLTAPDSNGIWSFGVAALYAQSNPGLQYASTASTDVDGNVSRKNQYVPGAWNWGVQADISYLFAGSSRDMNLSYTHIDFDNSDSPNSNSVYIVGSGQSGAPVGTAASSSYDEDLNAVSLTVGQLFHVGERVDLHPFIGLQFADINDTNKINYTLPISSITNLNIDAKLESDFVGVGPRAGLDGSVHLGKGFSIIGTLAGSVLVGSMDASTKAHNTAGNVFEQNIKFAADDYTAVVPELDAKAGVDYFYAFNPATSMNLQAGYQVVNYFNANSINVGDMQFANSVNQQADFNYQGPYARIQLNLG